MNLSALSGLLCQVGVTLLKPCRIDQSMQPKRLVLELLFYIPQRWLVLTGFP